MTETPKSSQKPVYVDGGTLQPGRGIYIKRPADDEVYDLCHTGEYLCILTARQRGKSSLMVNAVERLAEDNIRCAIVNLEELGVLISPKEWYLNIVDIIAEQLELQTDVLRWWEEREHQPESKRMLEFFQKVLLEEIQERVVVFIDEIDTTLKLAFTDDFFITIRSLYNQRGQKPVFQRLSFVLIGVATPSELIKDKERTPYNIGKLIDLTDFTLEEAAPLAAGLVLPDDQAQQVVAWVLDWTGGHPYLSQRLLKELAAQTDGIPDRAQIDEVVSRLFLNPHSSDHNIKMVSERLDPRKIGTESGLRLYYRILSGRKVMDDEESAKDKEHLKLSGIVKVADGQLVIRNRIYAEVFDQEWLSELFVQQYSVPLNILENQLRQQEAELVRLKAQEELEQAGSETIEEPVPTAVPAAEEEEVLEDFGDFLDKGDSAEATKAPSVRTLPNPVRRPTFPAALTSEETPPIRNWFAEQSPSLRLLRKRLMAEEGREEETETIEAGETPVPELDLEMALRFAADVKDRTKGLKLEVEDWRVISYVNPRNSLREIADAIKMSAEDLSRVVNRLVGLGLVELTDIREEPLKRFASAREEQARARHKASSLRGRLGTVSSRLSGALNKRLEGSGVARHWRQQLTQAETKILPVEYLSLRLGLALGLGLLSLLVLAPDSLVLSGVLAVLGYFLPHFYLEYQIDQRLSLFEYQLPDITAMWVNSLRSGYSVLQSLEALATTLGKPAVTEFRRVVQEVQLGIPFEDALDHMLYRVPSERLGLVFTAVNIQREVGGNLAEILDSIGYTVRHFGTQATRTVSRARLVQHISVGLLVLLAVLQLQVFGAYFGETLLSWPGLVVLALAYGLISLAALFSAELTLWLRHFLRDTRNGKIDEIVFSLTLLGLAYTLEVPLGVLLVLAFLMACMLAPYPLLTLGVLILALVAGWALSSAELGWAGLDINHSFILIVLGSLVIITGLMVLSRALLHLLRTGFWARDPVQERLAYYGESEVPVSLEELELSLTFRERLIEPLVRRLMEFLARFTAASQAENTERLLVRAGRSTQDPNTVLGLRVILALASLVILPIILTVLTNWSPLLWLLVSLLGAGLNYNLPLLWLRYRIMQRHQQIRQQLPDAVDLMTLCVEAGLGFEQAMGKVYERWDTDLSRIFGRTLQETQLGRTRRDALQNAAERLDLPEFTSLTAALIQAEQLGVSISKILRVQGDQLREERRDRSSRRLTDYQLASDLLFRLLLLPGVVLWMIAPLIADKLQ
jgi:Flp pilus assembly protein TadB